MKYRQLLLLVSFFAILGTTSALAQKNKIDQLEAKRIEIKNQIKQINALLFQNQSKQKSQTTLIEDLNYKLSVRRNLIKVTNQQANLINREIAVNQKKISGLRDELVILKDNYAKTILNTYKNKSSQSRVMFLLSSNNFRQAYKRLQYMNQYSKYQKQQGENIKEKALKLQNLNLELGKQKAAKDKLIAENREVQKALEVDMKQHETIMASIKKDLNKYAAQIKEKQQEAREVDREIDRIIKEAIANSNKKAGTKTTTTKASSTFALTPEAKLLAADFLSNKGKLVWPVEKGLVKVKYGVQRHPTDASLTINSSGVRIATEQNAIVRSVFKGEVLKIIIQKRGNPTVLIKHGNYISAYHNLKKISVKTGDKIVTKQEIGEVFTNSEGETLLWFSLYKNDASVDPAEWIYKM
ncbi:MULTISPECIES: murein hydrolase activator EnvC family protein [unclassified Olleya]|jgi:septal ring factor EnvC (AmiA/AmiB activator)|uniref:murein hydrolase activator EnvC family protein n=1 Tax=unclassified Olleya TaxID=2615019 RepID=UPI0011A65465|nr:peptidoglycan DD-metalloendopeptidase family protein [Olleya sp. Hel_I_94]TVZ48047.1 septal ring factor EnvC (AmiA/AmiB activator) [Olleya sp. Hel_I_94]